jgi:ubiquinone/menaquinone biosynthesis C-methylase UbiE/NAD-dependent dihydropyrimidine dehydrogenase PreA subunit
MFSYIFMKILESRPSRYDRGINILTGGHAKRVKREIVDKWVRPGMEVLDVGCGTGELLEYAVRAGARATGIDISGSMLSMARKRFDKEELRGRAELRQAGVIELDRLFEDKRFDLVTSTLVFSELYNAERQWAYEEIARLLKDSGIFVLAGEVRPRGFVGRLVYLLMRLPLAVVTYLIAQTGTRAVPDMAWEVAASGMEVLGEKRSFLGSFSVLWARKSEGAGTAKAPVDRAIAGEQDASVMRTAWDYVGRWFPSPVEPGLRKIGSPDQQAPVFVTCNFHLTLRRVEKALSGMDAWLLAAPSNGINVWCASCSGELNTRGVIGVMKICGISTRVTHRRLILPQFSAPGIDIRKLKQDTGFHALFGPAYAKDIPEFIKKDGKKSPVMCSAKYPLSFRLEMLLSMNALIWAVIAAVALIFNPALSLVFSLLFWGAGIVLYAGYPWIPGNSGWLKGSGLGVLIIIVVGIGTYSPGNGAWYAHWGWMLATMIICFWLGFDLRGIVEGSASEATELLERLGMSSIGKFYSSHIKTRGMLTHDIVLCTHCRTCMGVCPKGVFDLDETGNRVVPARPEACFSCGACVFQCPEHALEISYG